MSAITTYAIHTWSGRRITSSTEHQDAAQQVGDDHQPPPVDAIDDHAGHRPDDGDRQELDDHHPGDGGRRAGQIEQQREDGDGIEPVAELRNRLADEEQPEVAVVSQERGVGHEFIEVSG